MGEPIKPKVKKDEIPIPIILMFLCIFCCIGALVLVLIGVDLPQPQPTSDLINKSVNINSVDTSFPGFQNEFYDSDGHGYYYTQWFKELPLEHVYDISYYRDKNGDRRIYTYVDRGVEPEKDKARCIMVGGMCQ